MTLPMKARQISLGKVEPYPPERAGQRACDVGECAKASIMRVFWFSAVTDLCAEHATQMILDMGAVLDKL